VDFDVALLELPEQAGERAKLSIDYPFRTSGYIDSDANVVVTAARIDLLRGSLWLDARTPVRAFGAQEGRVSIERVRFNEAHGNNDGNDFWVMREDLSSLAALARAGVDSAAPGR
jgi:hypothetical protein